MMREDKCPHPRRSHECGIGLENIADNFVIGKDVEIVVVPLVGSATKRRALEGEVVFVHSRAVLIFGSPRSSAPNHFHLALDRKASYAAQARARARACSPGKVPLADVTSSRVCLPPSSSINENSHCPCGGLIVTVRRPLTSVIRNWPYWRPSC